MNNKIDTTHIETKWSGDTLTDLRLHENAKLPKVSRINRQIEALAVVRGELVKLEYWNAMYNLLSVELAEAHQSIDQAISTLANAARIVKEARELLKVNVPNALGDDLQKNQSES
jgi:hypothetical protein